MAKKTENAIDLWSSFDSDLEKRFGQGVLMSEDTVLNVEKTSTGIVSLDIALGGGFADGRFAELIGLESSGKTTVAIHAMIGYQKKFPNKAVGIIDFEHAFDKQYAKNLGLDTSKYRWRLSQPDNAEQGMDILNAMLNSGLFSCIVVDSIAAMVTEQEFEGDAGDKSMGVLARLMGLVCRKNTGIAYKNNTSVLWINQLREKIGVVYGNPFTSPGGNAMRFFASQRLQITKKYIQDKTEKAYSEVEVIKNKVAAPFKKATLYMVYGKGVDKVSDIFDVCVSLGFIEKRGAWFYLVEENKETSLGQGRENVVSLLSDNVELLERLRANVLENLKNN